MAISADGYRKLRETIQNNWTYVAVTDAAGAQIGSRLQVGVTTGVTWSDDAVTSPLVLNVVLKGDGSTSAAISASNSTVVKGLQLFDASTGGVALDSETYATSFTFQNAADQLTLKLTITTSL